MRLAFLLGILAGALGFAALVHWVASGSRRAITTWTKARDLADAVQRDSWPDSLLRH